MPTCCKAPRSFKVINGSLAICSEKRVQRAHKTQRSRSSNTCEEILIGFSNTRFTPSNRLEPCPVLMAWFCNGHSPPLSQTGQSSGWLTSNSSITPRCAFSATVEVNCVFTIIPGSTGIVHESCGFGNARPLISISTKHWRQAPTGSSNG